MSPTSPLLNDHQSRDALLSLYGDAEHGAPLVQTFGHLDIEYAALRKHCVLFDAAHRATIQLTGNDRLSFLDAMITQRVRDLAPGDVRDSFWLNRKGRIVADLRVVHLEDRTLLDVDTLAATQTAESLESFLFAEDVTIADRSDQLARLWLPGPTAPLLLDLAGSPDAARLDPGRALETSIDGTPVLVVRSTLGELPFFELTAEPTRLPALYQHLLELGALPHTQPGDPLPDTPASNVRLRVAGWHAINIARVESGRPMFNLDFGPSNPPAETGLLDSRVDFRKGCYLGQEVVARMHARGHPKQTLVALRIENPDDAHQAETGAEIFAHDAPDKPIGAITSSTISPMLGGAHIALAMVRWGAHQPGTTLRVAIDDRPAPATVQPRLPFWPPAGDS